MSLPARDSKHSADAWILSECTVGLKRREMETTRGEWENDQHVKERSHTRLPKYSTSNQKPPPKHIERHQGLGIRREDSPSSFRDPTSS
jgi:hypothetical protein